MRWDGLVAAHQNQPVSARATRGARRSVRDARSREVRLGGFGTGAGAGQGPLRRRDGDPEVAGDGAHGDSRGVTLRSAPVTVVTL